MTELKYFRTFVLLFLFALLFCSACNSELKKQEERPNIVVIYSDDQRQDAAGFNGNEIILTPTLDKMAARGIGFTNANVVFSLCSPSRAALLTGRYGSANGVLHLGSDFNKDETTVASYLKTAGYNTAISGKWHIGRSPAEAGFDFYSYFEGNGTYYGREIIDMGRVVKPEIHCDEYCVTRSIDFLKDAAKKDQPFFLFHNTQLPHMNGQLIWDAKKETLAKYDQTKMPVARNRLDDLQDKPEYLKTVRNRTKSIDYGYPDSVAIQKHTKEYYSVITEMDNALGRLFQTVEELDLMKNTYIIFMGDNGWMLGEHGFTSKVLPYRPSTRVPSFILGPDIEPGTNNNLILNIDITPTVLDLAGVELPDNLHGKSFAAIRENENLSLRDAYVYEGLGNYGGAKPNLAVINKDYRYIVTYKDEKLDEVTFRELYDQKNDPDEMHNLMNDLQYDEIIGKMDELIKQHRTGVLKMEN
jgi:arylsulfatase A-like enzyme